MEIDMLYDMCKRMFTMPLVIMILSLVLRIVKDLMQGDDWEVLREEKKTKEEIKEEVKEEKKRINIDKNLQKYFDYKE